MTKENGLEAWERNADFWDAQMGDFSNEFHRTVVRPGTEALLEIHPGDFVLDAACGNGNFSRRLAELGARVVAFDYSPGMIAHAKKRAADAGKRIEFQVCDATDLKQLKALQREVPFDKAVSNMAVMDIADIHPLFHAIYDLLAPGGRFVFTTCHPCFGDSPEGKYLHACLWKGEAISGQPVLQNYYHRSLQEILNPAFGAGFVLDRLLETPFRNSEIPAVLTCRLQKK